MSPRVPITFSPDGITVEVEVGTTVLDAAQAAGLAIPAPCGGRGVCGSCGVKVLAGALADSDDAEIAGLARAPKGVRLACRARVVGPVEVRPLAAHPRAVVRPGAGGESDGGRDDVRALVAGVDLGTTSVAAVIIDAVTGRRLASSSVPNRQQTLGADVLSRISAALAGAAPQLRVLAELSVIDALCTAAQAAGVSSASVERLVVAGNSTMSALLAGADTSPLAAYPFTTPRLPATLESAAIAAVLGTGAQVTLVPSIAGFVGGDALAGVMGTGMFASDSPTLLIDLGTNAEIVLAQDGRLIVASAAAGPALEGSGISCGGPAANGAVTMVSVGGDGAVRMEVLGDGDPLWFSGSGLLSAVAVLRRLGHVDASGLMHAEGPLGDRYAVDRSGVAGFALGSGSGCLSISQLDVRAVQLAKAAIRVGIESVLRASRCAATDLGEVLVAGAFGFSLRPEELIELGVLPFESLAIARHAGNAALDGAAAFALDARLLSLAEEVAAHAENVELAGMSGFNEAFLAAMALEPYSVG